MKKLMIAISLIFFVGCAAKQEFIKTTAHTGLPMLIEKSEVMAVVSNGSDCQVFLTHGMVTGVRNCGNFKKQLNNE